MTQGMRAAGLHRDPAEDNRRVSGMQSGADGRSPAQPGAVVVLIILNMMFWLFQFPFFSESEFVWLPTVSCWLPETLAKLALPMMPCRCLLY